jgi:mannitol-1-/sugar-/sorbitol-6-phosphatase
LTEGQHDSPASADAGLRGSRRRVAFRLSESSHSGQFRRPADWSVTAEALLLDLDGTRHGVISSWGVVAEQTDVPFAVIKPYIHGIPAEQVLERVAPHVPAARRASLAEHVRRLQASPDAPADPMPGARELLTRLGDVPWAIVTSADTRLATATLNKAGLPKPPILITADDVPLGKPHPHPYLQAARAVQVPARRCLAIEDSPPGIQAALDAGMAVVALTTTHSREDVRAAHYIATDLASVSFQQSAPGLGVATGAQPIGGGSAADR